MEMIREGETGLLADFFDPEEFAAKAVDVLKDPAAHRPLGRAAERLIAEQYSLDAVLPRMLGMYEDAIAKKPGPRVKRYSGVLNADPAPGASAATKPVQAKSPFRT
jgi:hypothetical protein